MKEINLSQLKIIQLDILVAVDEFCKENNIKYSLSGGTAIGAIRHKGYIPWDDDIDIMMTRANYEKFISSYDDGNGIYKLHCLENDAKYAYPYAKVEDTRTILNENSTAETLGINIDVFPVDALGDTKEESEEIIGRISKLRFKLKVKLILPGEKNSFVKKLGICVFKILFSPYNMRKLAEQIQNIAKYSYNKSKKKYCGVVVWGYGKKEIVPSSLYDKYFRVDFEAHKFLMLDDYDTYLSSVYGNYMQLPPVEKRQSPHTLNNVFWKDGYQKIMTNPS